MLNNKKVLETLLICEGARPDEGYDYDILDDTDVDFKYWIDKGRKLNVSRGLIVNFLMDIVDYGNDKDKEGFERFEKCFDFIFNTFKEMSGLDEVDTDEPDERLRGFKNQSTVNWFIDAGIGFESLKDAFRYNKYCGNIVVIDGRELLIDTSNGVVSLVDSINKEVVYKDIVGFEKDLVSGKVDMIYNTNNRKNDWEKMYKNKDINKCIVSFLDYDGYYVI